MKGNLRNISICLIILILIYACSNDDSVQEVVITSFTPASEGAGNSVLIEGSGFGMNLEAIAIDFNGTQAEITALNDVSIFVKVPVGATSGPISIQIADQRISSADAFMILPGVWSQKQDIPSEVGFGAAVGFALGEKGYVGSGGDNGRILDNFWEYNPRNDLWSALPAIPGGPRRFSSSFMIADKPYLGLGVKDNETTITSEFYSYDASSEIWTQLNNFPGDLPIFRDTYAAFTANDQGYLILEKEIWVYEVDSDAWLQRGTYPGNGTSHHIVQIIDGTAFIGLGFNDAFDWWSYNAEMDVWNELATYPGEFTWGLQSFQIHGKVYVVGKSCWEYDPETNQWAQSNSHPDGRRFGVAFSVGDKGYLGAGISIMRSPGNFQSDFWEFIP